jgi:5-methylcytosine-specific restriction endonuclease McrA
VSTTTADQRRRVADHLWPANGLCCYCDVPMKRYGDRGPLGATLDHYLPSALGGSDEEHNLRLCCRRCNNAKANLHPLVWEAMNRPKHVPQLTRYERKVLALQRCAHVRRNSTESTSVQTIQQISTCLNI